MGYRVWRTQQYLFSSQQLQLIAFLREHEHERRRTSGVGGARAPGGEVPFDDCSPAKHQRVRRKHLEALREMPREYGGTDRDAERFSGYRRQLRFQFLDVNSASAPQASLAFVANR